MGKGVEGATAPLKKVSKKEKNGVFSYNKVTEISFSVIFNKEIHAL